MKNKTSIIVFFMILIIVGIGSIFYGYYYFSHGDLASKKISIQNIEKNQEEQSPEVISYDVNLIHPISNDDVVQAQIRDHMNLQRNLMVGAIWIPDVSLRLPIYKGFTNDHQYLGACTYQERTLGKDNYILLGHNMLDQGQLFSPLKYVYPGMIIYITDYHKLYLFEVYFSEIVYKNRDDLIENNLPDGKTPIITLVTCYGGYNTDKRTVVIGKLIADEFLENSAKEIKEVFKFE